MPTFSPHLLVQQRFVRLQLPQPRDRKRSKDTNTRRETSCQHLGILATKRGASRHAIAPHEHARQARDENPRDDGTRQWHCPRPATRTRRFEMEKARENQGVESSAKTRSTRWKLPPHGQPSQPTSSRFMWDPPPPGAGAEFPLEAPFLGITEILAVNPRMGSGYPSPRGEMRSRDQDYYQGWVARAAHVTKF